MPETGSAAFRVAGEIVTVFLMDGSSVVGKVDTFSEAEPELCLGTGGPVSERYPTNRIAYIALHANGEATRQSTPADGVAYKIHLHSGELVAVRSERSRTPGSVGFRAFPAVAGGRYREYFFFSEAVRLRERDEPIGSMLVSAGALHPEVLEHAIVAQKAHQNTPIGKLLVESLSVSESDLARAVALQKQRNNRLGDLLIEEGLATREQIEGAFSEQQRRKSKRLGEVLLDLDIVSEETLARTLARKFDLEYVDLDAVEPEAEALAVLGKEVVGRCNVLPIRKSERGLVIAVSDPLLFEAIPELAALRVQQVLATPSALKRRIQEFLSRTPGVEESAFDFLLPALGEPLRDSALPKLPLPEGSVPPAIARAMLDEIVHDACKRGASAIHFEPSAGGREVRVRLRAGGALTSAGSVSAAEYAAMRAAVSDARDSTLTFRLRDRSVQLHWAYMSTEFGEDLTLAVADRKAPATLATLDLPSSLSSEWMRIAREPRGMLLSAGRPGPDRATVLHAALAELDSLTLKICSVERPPATLHPGVRTLAVDPSADLSFSDALRTMLRADPDVVLLGALEDARIAAEAVEAAFGPRLVLAALTATGAAEALERLVSWNIDPYVLGEALLGVHAARWVRRCCAACREPYAASAAEERAIADAYGTEEFARDFGGRAATCLELWRSRGCSQCGQTGARGQIAVHELLVPNQALRQALGRRAPAEVLRHAARAGGARALVHDGVQKALRGEVELRDVLSAVDA